ncbi:flagellar type III secretion system pore protein FliP, partial [Desulfobacterales bacterium HSG17]|nr:flagellar type III secretion system pore protein FliP [Desulfobacterales bacterium HSG17]
MLQPILKPLRAMIFQYNPFLNIILSSRLIRRFLIIMVVVCFCGLSPIVSPIVATVDAQTFPIPSLNIGIGTAEPNDTENVVLALEIIGFLTVITLAPAILILMTSFTRLIIVFHFLRQAIGTQSTPPNQVLVGLSLFLTVFIMAPVWQQAWEKGLKPYLDEEISFAEGFEEVQAPFKLFMLNNTRQTDLAMMIKAAKGTRPKNREDVSLLTLIPAFVLSELKTGFIIRFVLYVPFLVI